MEHSDNLRDQLDIYFSKWKWILASVLICLIMALIYLRYAQNNYEAHASIMLKDDKSTNKLPEISALQSFGLFNNSVNKVIDEIEVIQSKELINQTVKELKMNIQYFVTGTINDHELFQNSPISIEFNTTDSIRNKIDTTFVVKINSNSSYDISGVSPKSRFNFLNLNNSNTSTNLRFTDSLNTKYGYLKITSNDNAPFPKSGTTIEIKIIPMDKVVSLYQLKLKPEIKETSNVIKLSIKDNVRAKAIAFLNTLIIKYNEDGLNDREKIMLTTSKFINSRLNTVTSDLADVDVDVESFKQDNKLTDIPEQSSLFLKTEKENEANLINMNNQIQLISYMQDYLVKNSNNSDLLPSSLGIENESANAITQKYNELVLQKNRILKSSSEKNPVVIGLNQQIESLKTNLNSSLNNTKSSYEITLANIQNQSSKINSQLFSAPKKEREFREIKRQQDIKEALYLYLLQKREESVVTLGAASPNSKTIDLAYSNPEPVSPKVPFTLLASIILGMIIPIGFIYVSDVLDNKVHTKKDLTNLLSIPYIGEIPKSGKDNMLIKKVDYSPKAESFRILRTNIDFMLQNITHKSKIVFVTSTTSQEGKSHTSVNLALSLSFSEKKVLFIETDIRVPKASKYLDVKNQKGLTDYISNNHLKLTDIIVAPKDNMFLDIIPSGTIPPNPAELLLSDRVKDLFETINNDYDYIIVDTAAVGLVTDTLLISKFADLFIYVVKANYVNKRSLQLAQTMYDDKRLPNMALLLNNSDPKRNSSYGGGGYGYGYGYGYGKNPNTTTKTWWKKLTS